MFRSISGPIADGLAKRVFGLFKSHAPSALNNLRQSLQESPIEVSKLVHALKSMCASAGAPRAAAICAELERRAKQGEHLRDGDLGALQQELDRALVAMEEHIAGQKPTVPDGKQIEGG